MPNAQTEELSLGNLLKLLRENGVAEYQQGSRFIKFSERAALHNPMISEAVESKPETSPKQDEERPYFPSMFGGANEGHT